ncbi:hypothetical protein CNYM01_12418 [Colletotrichum nymphaeae SA-01]|uniref:Uncharacterized protein n=1 Tax=Colletotrichum nymphaeae SA-01 TaxID=1460502 RepID=A0A135T700_9PEZI|nr:hypothetical protein CNYM01_12418 [Colletotrichum nymphaeae SA-01]
MGIVKFMTDLAHLTVFTLLFLLRLLRPQAFWARITRASKTAELYSSDNSDEWVRLYEPGRFIGIWDDVGSSSGQTDAQEPFAFQDAVMDDDANNAQLDSLMSGIPPQMSGVARVFLQETFEDDLRENDSTSGEGFPYKFPPLRAVTMGFLSLLTAHPKARPVRWYMLESFIMITSQKSVDYVNTKRYLRFQGIDGQLQAFIMCRTFISRGSMSNTRRLPEGTFDLYQATASFITHLRELDDMYRPFKNTSNWIKAFSLQFCHADLLLYAHLLLNAESVFKWRRGLMNPIRGAELQQGSVERIIADHRSIQKFTEVGDRMLGVIESLVEILQNAKMVSVEQVAERKQQLSTILLVVSFVIGMFKDIDLGARVLGFGIVVISFPAVMAVGLTFLLSLTNEVARRRQKARKAARESSRAKRRRQGRERDEESATPVNPPEPTTKTAELASDGPNREISEDEVANE